MTDSDNSEEQPIQHEEIGTDPLPGDAERGRDNLYVVVIGTSSGGKEALTKFFQHMPNDSGMAFLVLQHSQDQFAPILVESLKRLTQMDVVLAKHDVVLNPNKIYVMPTEIYTSLVGDVIHLDEESTIESMLAIDMLMNAVAEAKRENAIGVILSGRGFDGSDGIKAIKAAGGLVVVQEPETAEFPEMPRNAIATNLVDIILSPEDMPAELIRYIHHLEYPLNFDSDFSESFENPALQKIFFLLRSQTGHDFSLYKRKTVHRRIHRRIVVNQLEDLTAYYAFLQKHPDEVNRLFHEFLIGVTQFFRDPDAFNVLEEQVIPRLFTGKRPDSRVRIWVPGCSTGEEAYSLAILLHEYLETQDLAYGVQIFATDIDESAIQVARTGSYPLNISSHVSPRRLQRFFTKEGNGYQIRKQIREMVTFAVQSVVKDPPFSKLDLISCRNLLIYLRPELQSKLIPLFHYVLNPGGVSLSGNLGDPQYLYQFI